MDIKEYIASGILESYALGFSSEQERREVECMSSIYPEIKEELNKIQSSLEGYALSIAVKPPSSLKDAIMKEISEVKQDPVLRVDKKEEKESTDSKVIQMTPSTGKWRTIAAASIVALVALGSLLYMQVDKTQRAEDSLAKMQTELNDNNALLANLNDSLQLSNTLKDLILDASTDEIKLAGTDLSPSSNARVFWNTSSSEILLVSDALPTPEIGKQYQLWAIADGKPVDMGVLALDKVISDPISLDNISNIQAFAITLEKEGGSEVPTLDQMYVLGAVAS